MRTFLGGFVLFCFLSPSIFSQVGSFPYEEQFDSAVPPSLPEDWLTTSNRLTTGDFFVTTTSPRSAPHAAQSTNSVISQSLTSPRFDFSGRLPDALQFFAARSGTHTSPLLIEASTDDGVSFPLLLADTLYNPGTTSYTRTLVQLPPTLRDQPSVRFRWRVLGGSGGSTGTLRIDDVTVTTVTAIDLSVENLIVAPLFLNPTIPLDITLTVKNLGLTSASAYVVDLFLANKNETPDLGERFSSLAGPALPPGDSVGLQTSRSPLPFGTYRISAIMNFPGDERKDNDTAFALVTVGATPGSVLVNEIMYAPAGDEPEWVELFNPTTDTIDLKGWRISDNNTVTKTLISPTQFLLPPKGYALIAKDSSLFSVRPQITAPTRIVSFAALNNTTPDAVVLFDDRLITIDSVLYSPDWGGRGGASLERIDEYAHSTDRSNWGTSIDSTGATPGTINSIAKLTDDLELVKAYGEQTIIIVEVRNAGRRTAESFQVLFFQTNGENNTPFGTVTFPGSLSPGSSAGLTYDWTDAPVGETRVTVHVAHPPDQRLQNNTSVFTMRRSSLPRELIINEIMYEPISGQNEWIEVFHRGTNPVDLAGWSFMDRPTVSGNRNVFSFGWSSRKILPGEFVVIAAESTIFSLFPSLLHSVNVIILNRAGGFSLGNNGDDIVLKDLLGTIIDSVRYEPSWHHPDVADVRGRSLERIHPDLETNDRRNWSTSAERIGGSPGRRNSIFTERTFSVAALSFSPNPFSPDGDGHEDFCLIRYVLPHETFITRLRIFDVQGRLIRTLADGEPAGSQGEIIWDGFDSEKRRARIGPYIVLLEATDRGGHAVLSARGVVVVATRL